MQALNQNEVNELLDIIRNFHLIFTVSSVGAEMLSDVEKEILKQGGVDIDTLGINPMMDDAFHFGMLAAAMKTQSAITNLNAMTHAQMKSAIKQAGGIPLTTREEVALKRVKTQAYMDIKGLGNRVLNDYERILNSTETAVFTEIEGSAKTRAEYEKIIRDSAVQTVGLRKTAKILASEIGRATSDWTRDFDRISDYVMHTAYQYGRAEEYDKINKSRPGAMYYKQVYAGACKHCIRLYLTAGIGSKPKLFKMADLLANGSNIGRKVNDWQPVVGATHPFCRCELLSIDTNLYEWDEEIGDFVAKKVESTKFHNIDTDGLVEIKIGDKIIKV